MTKLNILACGGAGMAQMERFINSDLHGNFRVFGFNTSTADVRALKGYNESNTFLIPGVDGAGQERAALFPKIKQHLPTAMLACEPADVNLIVCSLAGGTGGVWASLILEYLLKGGHKVIMVCSGNQTTHQFATNTLKTLQTIDAMAARYNCVVPMVYSACVDGDEPKQDSYVSDTVTSLTALLSGELGAMDSTDIGNFLNHGKFTDFNGRCNLLEISTTGKMTSENILSAATILYDRSVIATPCDAIYHTKGYCNITQSGEPIQQIVYGLSETEFDKLLESSGKVVSDLERRKQAITRGLTRVSAPVDEDGFVW